jgi:hypothetical protein
MRELEHKGESGPRCAETVPTDSVLYSGPEMDDTLTPMLELSACDNTWPFRICDSHTADKVSRQDHSRLDGILGSACHTLHLGVLVVAEVCDRDQQAD